MRRRGRRDHRWALGLRGRQSGVGDIFGWFVDTSVPPLREAAAEAGVSLHDRLTALAAQQRIGEHGLIALDWHSGNRSVLVDHELSSVIVGHPGHPPRTSTTP